jgi:hypothetical protein
MGSEDKVKLSAIKLKYKDAPSTDSVIVCAEFLIKKATYPRMIEDVLEELVKLFNEEHGKNKKPEW